MSVSFANILQHLKEYGVKENKLPPALVHGGDHYPIDLSKRRKFNLQLILVAHEFNEMEGIDVIERVRNHHEKQLGTQFLAYRFNELEEVETVLEEFSSHYHTVLDRSKIIRKVNESPKQGTYFYLYVAVLKLPYFE